MKDEQKRNNEVMRIASYDGALIDPDDWTLTTMSMDENRIYTSRGSYTSLIVADDLSDNSSLTSSSDTDYFEDGNLDLSDDTKIMIVLKKQSLIRRVLYVILTIHLLIFKYF